MSKILASDIIKELKHKIKILKFIIFAQAVVLLMLVANYLKE